MVDGIAAGLAASQASETGKIRIVLSIQPPELAQLPWEMLYDPEPGFFLSTRQDYAIVRLVESRKPLKTLRPGSPPAMLYLRAQPEDMARLDLDASEQAVRQAFGARAAIERIAPAHQPGSRQALLARTYDYLHYDGHAFFSPEEEAGFLCLEDEQGKLLLWSGEMLASSLAGASLRLVVLAACKSGSDARSQRLAGIAHQLMKSSSLPAVVAMQFSIPDRAAIAFNAGFYAALALGRPLETALVEGRKAIIELDGSDGLAQVGLGRAGLVYAPGGAGNFTKGD